MSSLALCLKVTPTIPPFSVDFQLLDRGSKEDNVLWGVVVISAQPSVYIRSCVHLATRRASVGSRGHQKFLGEAESAPREPL